MSDDGLEGLRVASRGEPRRSTIGGALRGVALALLSSLLFGFVVGLWLRCQLERPRAPYLGAAPARAGVTHASVAIPAER